MKKKENVLIIQGDNDILSSPNEICTNIIVEELNKRNYLTKKITYWKPLLNDKVHFFTNTIVYTAKPKLSVSLILRNKYNPTKINKIISEVGYLISKIEGGILGLYWPLLDPIAVIKFYNSAKKAHEESPVDACIVVYKQIESVLAGILLKKKYPEINLVLYLLDAMSGSKIPNVLRSAQISNKSIQRWENLAFEISNTILIMEAHEEYYKSVQFEKYQQKIRVGDIPLLNVKRLNNHKTVKSSNAIQLVYTGSMSRNTANPTYLIDLLEKMNLPNVHFIIYGSMSAEIKNRVVTSKLYDKTIFFRGKMPHGEILKIQEEADVLVNFGNNNPCMIPSKIFEYISTGNKILSISAGNYDSSNRYLTKYSNSLTILESDNVESNIIEINEFILTQSDVNIDSQELEENFHKNTPRYFVDELEEILGKVHE